MRKESCRPNYFVVSHEPPAAAVTSLARGWGGQQEAQGLAHPRGTRSGGGSFHPGVPKDAARAHRGLHNPWEGRGLRAPTHFPATERTPGESWVEEKCKEKSDFGAVLKAFVPPRKETTAQGKGTSFPRPRLFSARFGSKKRRLTPSTAWVSALKSFPKFRLELWA